ncbi:MerR family transcriptional regulator [Acidovorax sp. Root267]|uniref:MerR family DNA-binding transcriptional regulator n=1 Tax=Acidovorax sp. Root267 TaxID=1736505 RepID=UPI00070B627B|nr:MerR family DNA-binding transcriptional regulator [Acidovorax sp. Root267]KRD21954.1 MerR family transcriptional regulator [Acidovorax sp. Root267]
MQISELAHQASVSVHALRHYERLGLIRPHRRANGYRDYPASIKREVVFIAMSRQLGFALPQIARRLDDYRAGTLGIDDMVHALRERAAALEQQISQLQAQKQVVLEHQAWLEAQQRKRQMPPPAVQAAQSPPAPGNSGNWPRVRPKTPTKSSSQPAPHRKTP